MEKNIFLMYSESFVSNNQHFTCEN